MDAADCIAVARAHWKILDTILADYTGDRRVAAQRLMETYEIAIRKARYLGCLERFDLEGYDYYGHQYHLTRMWLNSTRAVLMILRETHGPRRAVLRRLARRMHRTAVKIREVLRGEAGRQEDKRQLKFNQPIIFF
jgi:hypothetical protein